MKFVIRIRRKNLEKLAAQAGVADAREVFDLALEIGLLTLTAASRGKAAKA